MTDTLTGIRFHDVEYGGKHKITISFTRIWTDWTTMEDVTIEPLGEDDYKMTGPNTLYNQCRPYAVMFLDFLHGRKSFADTIQMSKEHRDLRYKI